MSGGSIEETEGGEEGEGLLLLPVFSSRLATGGGHAQRALAYRGGGILHYSAGEPVGGGR